VGSAAENAGKAAFKISRMRLTARGFKQQEINESATKKTPA